MKSVLLALTLSSIALLAEGLPKDEHGHLGCPHLTVSLNNSQVEELQILNSVTLTATQWKQVRQSSPNTPKRLQGILPITHNDCTCGESYAAVLLSDRKLAVFIEKQDAETLSYQLQHKKNLTLQVDKRGQFYLDGILTRFPNLVAALKESGAAPVKSKDDQSWLSVGTASIETPLFMSPTSPVYAARILEIGNLLESKGWSVYGPAYYALNDEN